MGSSRNTANQLVNEAIPLLEEKHGIYESEAIYKLSIRDTANELTENAIAEFLADPKVQARLQSQLVKQMVKKYRDRVKLQQADYVKRRKLWKASKGKIPCLRQCGCIKDYTEKEVMRENLNYVCAKCTQQLGDDNAFATFKETNIYKIFNID